MLILVKIVDITKLKAIEAKDVASKLRELEDAGNLPHRNGRLLRDPIALLFKLPRYAFMRSAPVACYSEHRDALEAYEKEWAARRLSDFCTTLRQLYDTGMLPISRGKVCRAALRGQLNVSARLINSGCDPYGVVVDRLDIWLREVEGRGLVWEEKAPLIRKWLEARDRDGSIPRNHWGLLNKSAVLRNFGLPSQRVWEVLKRTPKLRQVFLEFEERLAPDREQNRYSYTHLSSAAKKLLDADKIKLTHGRIVSIKDLARQLGISHRAINITPALAAMVQSKQAEVDKRNRQGRTCQSFRIAGVMHINLGATPYSERHGRIFSFLDLAETYSLKFCEYIGTAFHHYAQGLVSPTIAFYSLLAFLRWISDHTQQYLSVVSSMSAVVPIDKDAFEQMVMDYRAECITSALESADSGAKRRVKVQFAVIKSLGDWDVFPAVAHLLKKTKLRAGKDVSHRPSLAEATVAQRAVISILVDSARSRGLLMDRGRDAQTFSESVLWEKRNREDLPSDLSEAILVICEERLHAVRYSASEAFKHGLAALLDGDALVASAKHSGEEIASRINLQQGITSARRREVSILFPHDQQGIAIANLACFIRYSYQGICPTESNGFAFFARQYLKVGGVITLQNMLVPSRRMIAAGLILYLAESGANPSVAVSLARDPLEPSPTAGHKRAVGYKVRADKCIVDDLSIRHSDGLISAVEALEIISARSASDPGAPDRLATFVRGGEVRAMSEAALRDEFASIVRTHPLLSQLKITPSMLRPTRLLAVQLRNPSDLGIAQQIAQHASRGVTMGYVGKLPYRLILEEQIRKFSEHLQVMFAATSREAWIKLGIEELKWRELLDDARRTGMGLYCTNPLDSPQLDVVKGTKCLKLDRCITCQRRIVIAEPEAIADMMIWREGLRRAEPHWLENQTVRWERTWLPWLAFFQVVLEEKLSRGEFVQVKRQAERIVESRKADPSFRLVEPW